MNPAGVGAKWVVRRYFRGGLMRPFGDRFLRAGRPRSFVELENNARIEELGFTTPRVVAAAAYPSGLVYRADLVTEFVPDARTLGDVLFGSNDPSDGRTPEDLRREALACAAKLITRLSKAGVGHGDLNAENILIARKGEHVHAILIDLDACRVAGPSGVDAGGLRRRLVRSIRKLERTRQPFQGDSEEHLTSDEMDHLLKVEGCEQPSDEGTAP
jgi:3-deoxy-D-manno-octulosonic acid kinase